jgi:hypothetical protein
MQNGVHDFATNTFKIYVDALGRSGSEMLFPIGMFVVDGCETKVLCDPLAFGVRPAIPTTRQPWILPICPAMLPVAPAAAETTRVGPFSGLAISIIPK